MPAQLQTVCTVAGRFGWKTREERGENREETSVCPSVCGRRHTISEGRRRYEVDDGRIEGVSETKGVEGERGVIQNDEI